jgi:hypothetical protein
MWTIPLCELLSGCCWARPSYPSRKERQLIFLYISHVCVVNEKTVLAFSRLLILIVKERTDTDIFLGKKRFTKEFIGVEYAKDDRGRAVQHWTTRPSQWVIYTR